MKSLPKLSAQRCKISLTITTAKISSRLGFFSSGAGASTTGMGSESETVGASEAEHLLAKENVGCFVVENRREAGSFGLENERSGGGGGEILFEILQKEEKEEQRARVVVEEEAAIV